MLQDRAVDVARAVPQPVLPGVGHAVPLASAPGDAGMNTGTVRPTRSRNGSHHRRIRFGRRRRRAGRPEDLPGLPRARHVGDHRGDGAELARRQRLLRAAARAPSPTQIEAVVTDIGVGAAKTGMLASARDHARDRRGRAPGCRSRRSSSTRSPPRSTATRCCVRTPSTSLRVGDHPARHARHAEPRRGAAADRRASVAVPRRHGRGRRGDVRPRPAGGADQGRPPAERRRRRRALRRRALDRAVAARVGVTDHTHGSGDTLAVGDHRRARAGARPRGGGAHREGVRHRRRRRLVRARSGLGPVGHFWRVRAWPADAAQTGKPDQ